MRGIAVLLFATAQWAGAQVPRAYSYDFRLDPGGKKHGDVIHGTVQVSGDRARIDTDERDDDGDHGYLLVVNGGRTIISVHPDKRTYEEQDADEFARVLGTAMRAAGPVFKMSVRHARIDTARLGASTPVAGRATERAQLRQRWTTNIRVMGFTKELTGSSVAEYWTDPALPLMRNPLFDIVSTSMLAMASADEDFLDDVESARSRLFRGSPLKADIRVTIDDGDDGDDGSRLRYEVTKITPGPVNEAALQVPKDFRRTSGRTFKL